MVRLVAVVLVALSLSTAEARANAISVAVGPDPVAGVQFPVAVSWASASNLSPAVFVTVKPTGPGCAVNFYADFKWGTAGATGEDVFWQEGADVSGTATATRVLAAPGSYTLCAYLQDSERSETPYALTGPVVFNVRAPEAAPAPPPPPDPCPALKVAREEARQAAELAQTYVTRLRNTYRRLDRRADRAQGAHRTRRQRQAKLAHRKYRAAVKARAKARTAHTRAQQAIAAAGCPAP